MAHRPLIAVLLAAVTLPALLGATTEDSARRDPDRVGVLIVDHGEPPEYNADTYWSFREFFRHLMEMGFIPEELALIDQGTILGQADCEDCADGGRKVDAWLTPYRGPSVEVPGSSYADGYHLRPGGPGLGEPDIFEQVGLSAWEEWTAMGGRSPNYDQKLAQKRRVVDDLRDRHGPDLPVRIGYGIDPRIGGGHQDIRRAVQALVNRDRVGTIAVAYHGVGFSDAMQTHMVRGRIAEALDELGADDVRLVYADPMGVSPTYVEAVADRVVEQLRSYPPDAPVAIHLSEHGLPTGMCGEYDCGADAYHEFAADLFARTRAAILARVQRPGRTEVFQVYGDGGDAESDESDVVDSPIEALEKRGAARFRHVLDIPYAFGADSRDTLVVLRRGYARPVPDWDENYTSRFQRNGLDVVIDNASWGFDAKTAAFLEVIEDALGRARAGAGIAPPDHHG